MEAGNQTLLKKNNQRAITDYIISNGPISRADLSKVLKISKPTVSANITELLELNLLREIGFSETDIGKKPMLVDFNKEFSYVLALDFISYITHMKISVAVCNLYCEPVFIDTIPLPYPSTGDYVTNTVPAMLLELCAKNGIEIEKIGKLVLTAPTIHYDEDHIRFECQNGDVINLADVFAPWFKGKLAVKNDINLAALGEKYFGVGKNCDNLLFAWIGLAVGGGLILNGELYEGPDGSGGELAFTTVYNTATQQFELLRDVSSMAAIRKYIEANHDEAMHSSIADAFADNTFYLDMIIDAANQGDAFCIDFAHHVGKTAAVALANIAYTLNLQMIIVGGEYDNFGDIFLDEFREQVKTVSFSPIEVTTPFYTNSAMYGAFKFGAENIISGLI